MGQRVEADDIGGAVGGALRPADARTGQRVHLVEAEAEGRRVVHHGEYREDADAVGDEVRRVKRAHHALAQTRGQPGLQQVERGGVGSLRGDDLHQLHVARRVEEVDAAEARAHRLRQPLRQGIDRQARGVGGDDGIGREVWRDLRVQVVFPVHALGDGFDHQVASGQQRQVLVVVGGIDELEPVPGRQRGRFELLQPVERLVHDAVPVAFFRRQVEQQDRHVGVGQVRGDLRAHHAGAEHGGFPYDQLVQVDLLRIFSLARRHPSCIGWRQPCCKS